MSAVQTKLTPEETAQMYDRETLHFMKYGTRIFQGIRFGETDAAHVLALYDFIKPAKGAVIFDMGCGIGEVARLMLEIDPSLQFLCVTNSEVQYKSIPTNVAAELSDFHHLKRDDGHADILMFNESIGYAKLAQMMTECMRLLKPGGLLFIKDAVSTTGFPVVVPGWEYVFQTSETMQFVARHAGFQLEAELLPDGDMSRYAEYLQTVDGPDLNDIPVRPVIWRFRKPLNWDSKDWRTLRNEKLLPWMAGNVDAVNCVIGLSTISETWDDLIDRDKQVGPDLINEAFVTAGITLQLNPFYKQNEMLFYAVTVAGINAWMDATAMQKSDEEKWRMLSFYTRNYAYEIMSIAAFRAGGWEHLRKVSLEMRQFFAIESYQEWEHRHA